MIPARIIKPVPARGESLRRLGQEINGPDFVADLLLRLGIDEKEKARDFFLAPLEGILDGSLMLGMEKAVGLLLQARERGEPVVVHGDYDVDGVTATALLFEGLRDLGFRVDWFLPSRFVEGYGISFKSLEKLHAQGARWIVSEDTGISAAAEVERARELGISVIITDHHQAPAELPAAAAILNPNQPGCPYPNKGLSGVGVAYKLLDALTRRLRGRGAEDRLDLVALGSLADSVPLTGENRSLVKAGLGQLSGSRRRGLRALLERLSLGEERLGSGDILFKVAPVINAAGRMGNPALGMRLLIATDEGEARTCLQAMWDENGRRRKLDQVATGEAMAEAEARAGSDPACLVLASERWHERVIGIVAARLVDKYRKPAFVLSIGESGLAKGSGRTVTGFNLHKALATVPDLFEKWGGHYYACGFTIRRDRIAMFGDEMERLARIHLSAARADASEDVNPTVEIDLANLDEDCMTWIRRFEPFGPLNEHPLFYAEGAELVEPPRLVGGKHLKFTVQAGAKRFDAIGFNLGHCLDYVENHPGPLRLAFYPEWNVYNGQRRIQLRVVALQ